jgi:thioredoxin 1
VVEDKILEEIKNNKLKDLVDKNKELVTDKPIEVTDLSFSEIISKKPLVVVDCWAAWCAPCRMIAPIIDALAKEYSGKILFGKLNVDNNQKVAAKHQIMSIPTLLVFKNGQLVDRIIGVLPKKTLETKITQHL